MRNCIAGALLVVGMCISARSRAALYQFTLGGEVTASSYFDVSVGDPFAIQYLADSQDMNPNPAVGSYVATDPTITFPHGSEPIYGIIRQLTVSLNNADRTEHVRYLLIGLNEFFTIDLAFPQGTLATDALPLTLPMSTAIQARYEHRFFLAIVSAGDITSYSSAEIPDPRAAGLLLLLIAIVRKP